MNFPILQPSAPDVPLAGAAVTPGEPGEFADLIDALLASLGQLDHQPAEAEADDGEATAGPLPSGPDGSAPFPPVTVVPPALDGAGQVEADQTVDPARPSTDEAPATDLPASAQPSTEPETTRVPVPLVVDLPMVPAAEAVSVDTSPPLGITADEGAPPVGVESSPTEAPLRPAPSSARAPQLGVETGEAPVEAESAEPVEGPSVPPRVAERMEAARTEAEADVRPIVGAAQATEAAESGDADVPMVDRTATLALIEEIQEWAERADRSAEPSSISLEFPDPEGDLLVKVAMREGRIELNVIRPGGEAPAWLRDRLDEALSRHGFDMSHSDDRENPAEDRDEPMPRGFARPVRSRPTERDGIWM